MPISSVADGSSTVRVSSVLTGASTIPRPNRLSSTTMCSFIRRRHASPQIRSITTPVLRGRMSSDSIRPTRDRAHRAPHVSSMGRTSSPPPTLTSIPRPTRLTSMGARRLSTRKRQLPPTPYSIIARPGATMDRAMSSMSISAIRTGSRLTSSSTTRRPDAALPRGVRSSWTTPVPTRCGCTATRCAWRPFISTPTRSTARCIAIPVCASSATTRRRSATHWSSTPKTRA